jgi:putative SOS response-associated peptidase YedK
MPLKPVGRAKGAKGSRRLIPSWAKDETIGDKLTNARADTISEKPSYRKPFERQRCLIPSDGFYEWQTSPTGKQPFWFTMKGGGILLHDRPLGKVATAASRGQIRPGRHRARRQLDR